MIHVSADTDMIMIYYIPSEQAYHDFLHYVQKATLGFVQPMYIYIYLEVCVGDFDGKLLRSVDFL
jgi:hypothetical protein